MRKLFTLKTDSLLMVEVEGCVYSVYNHKTHKLSFYDNAGVSLPNYERPHLEASDISDETDEREDGLRYNKYGVACSDGYLVDADCMDVGATAIIRVTDEQAKELIIKISKCESVSDFQSLDPAKRDKYLKKLKEKGLSIRQLSRLTGIPPRQPNLLQHSSTTAMAGYRQGSQEISAPLSDSDVHQRQWHHDTAGG